MLKVQLTSVNSAFLLGSTNIALRFSSLFQTPVACSEKKIFCQQQNAHSRKLCRITIIKRGSDLTFITFTATLIHLLAYQMCPTNQSDSLKIAIRLRYWKSNLNFAIILHSSSQLPANVSCMFPKLYKMEKTPTFHLELPE